MKPQCPPGMICIETSTLLMIAIFTCFTGYWFKEAVCAQQTPVQLSLQHHQGPAHPSPVYNPRPVDSYTRLPDDTLLNPYVPPLRLSVPDSRNYHQIGILKSKERNDVVIPLMARSINMKRDMWNYYTLHERNTLVKLPVVSKSKSCTDERGCEALDTGDVVLVEGYKDLFVVTLYDTGGNRYDATIY